VAGVKRVIFQDFRFTAEMFIVPRSQSSFMKESGNGFCVACGASDGILQSLGQTKMFLIEQKFEM
jgi:hypothetical protein